MRIRKSVILWSFLLLLLVYMSIGAFIFWGSATIPKKKYQTGVETDIVLMFTGGEDRIKPTYDLVLNHAAKKMIMSPASESTLKTWADIYAKGVVVPFALEPRATSTHENAYYCSEIVMREHARKIILITSFYHMKRAYRLLALALKGKQVEIYSYPTYPFDIEDTDVLKRTPYFKAVIQVERTNMVFNYLKFLLNGYQIKECSRFEHHLEDMYESLVKRKLSKYEIYRTLRSM